jgi:hypothetical protein
MVRCNNRRAGFDYFLQLCFDIAELIRETLAARGCSAAADRRRD